MKRAKKKRLSVKKRKVKSSRTKATQAPRRRKRARAVKEVD
jgi:hypothetical protein